jgi:hypothetical protein
MLYEQLSNCCFCLESPKGKDMVVHSAWQQFGATMYRVTHIDITEGQHAAGCIALEMLAITNIKTQLRSGHGQGNMVRESGLAAAYH